MKGGLNVHTDWNAIKFEYISTEVGYRDLADKYQVSFTTLQHRAKKEDWPRLRRQTDAEVETRVMTEATELKTDRALRIERITDKLLDKIEITLDNIDGYRSNKAVKDVSDALKNARDILGIKTPEDKEEQRARIAKMKKDIEDDSVSKAVVIKFADTEIESWGD